MATQKAIAIRQAEALERMTKAANRLGRRVGVKLPDTEPAHKDAGIADAMRIEEMALFIERADTAVREQMGELEDEIAKLKDGSKGKSK